MLYFSNWFLLSQHPAYYCLILPSAIFYSFNQKLLNMSQQILQLNFKFNVSRNDYESMCSSLANDFAKVPGCQWKVWLMNEKNNEAGGIYLFEDEKALEQFKASPLAAGVLSHPALSDFSVKQFDILEDVSNITRAPLAMAGESV